MNGKYPVPTFDSKYSTRRGIASVHSSCLEEEAEVDAVVTVAVIAAVEEVEDQTRTVTIPIVIVTRRLKLVVNCRIMSFM